MPWYGLYALLFADHGLHAAQISSLFAIWSATGFVLEVPSGALADITSRRAVLAMGALVQAAGFATWIVFPSYAGFAAGFVLWGAAGALQSGTFEALVFDALVAQPPAPDASTAPSGWSTGGAYARVIGLATAGAQAAALVAIASATPLFALGGYTLVGSASVAVAVAQGAIALSLPAVPRAEATSAPNRYRALLRAGLGEAARGRTVRMGVVLTALLLGFTAFDEYFSLLAGEHGVSTTVAPLLVGLAIAGTVIGSAAAGRMAAARTRTLAAAVLAAGIAFTAGALIGGTGAAAVVAFAAIGAGYGLLYNAAIVSESRLQDAIEGPARATVTSLSGLTSEVVSLAVFGFVALTSLWLPIGPTLALLGAPVMVTACLVPRWLPRHRAPTAIDEPVS